MKKGLGGRWGFRKVAAKNDVTAVATLTIQSISGLETGSSCERTAPG